MGLRHSLNLLLPLTLLATTALPADAQFGRLRDAARRAIEDETARQIDRLLREAVRCALDDPICVERARDQEKEVIFVDADGNVITDDEGVPITDQTEAAERAGIEVTSDDAPPIPGEGVWANYDFVPGEQVLFVDDFTQDDVGDFPRRLEYLRGNMEVVDWDGRRLLRATGENSRFRIVLDDDLPQRFTLEFSVHDPITEGGIEVHTGEVPERGRSDLAYVDIGHWRGSGIHQGGEPLSTVDSKPVEEGVVTARVMADGEHVRVYLDEVRIANVPRADLGRTPYVTFVMWARADRPMYLGDIRLAGGGRDLYDALAENGRVATRGILFAVNSDRILPESTPTLEEISTMLTEYGELRLLIEGHTDSDGDEAFNLELSERRAEAVKRFLVDHHGIDAERLETVGLGETRPVAPNDTAEGKQQNRRVELVRR